MADEIKIRAELSVVKGSVWDGLAVRDLLATMAGTNVLHHVQAVGTAEENLAPGDAGFGGWCLLRNLGPTNFVSVRSKLGETPFARMNVNEPCGPFRVHASAVPTLQADTAAVDVEVFLIEA